MRAHEAGRLGRVVDAERAETVALARERAIGRGDERHVAPAVVGRIDRQRRVVDSEWKMTVPLSV